MVNMQNHLHTPRLLLALLVLVLCLVVLLVLLPSPSETTSTLFISNNKNQTQTQSLAYSFTFSDETLVPNPDDFKVCAQINEVPLRTTNKVSFGPSLPFSMRKEDFQRHHLYDCQSSDEILQAIQNGHREWSSEMEGLDDATKETHPSTFIPQQCHIPTFSRDEMCHVWNQFSDIIFSGDSLTRHIMEAIHITLTNKFIVSGWHKDFIETQKCRCDGQFSEVDDCRYFRKHWYTMNPIKEGLCPALAVHNRTSTTTATGITQQKESSFIIHKIDSRNCVKWDQHHQERLYEITKSIDCSRNTYKGMLLILQGGLHFHMNATQYTQELLEPLLNFEKFRSCAKYQKLYIIWQDHGTQSKLVNQYYPYQDSQHTIQFNQEVHAYLNQRGLSNVPRINWMNLTKLSLKSDGVHGLLNGKNKRNEVFCR
jgi:hypothetical protein